MREVVTALLFKYISFIQILLHPNATNIQTSNERYQTIMKFSTWPETTLKYVPKSKSTNLHGNGNAHRKKKTTARRRHSNRIKGILYTFTNTTEVVYVPRNSDNITHLVFGIYHASRSLGLSKDSLIINMNLILPQIKK